MGTSSSARPNRTVDQDRALGGRKCDGRHTSGAISRRVRRYFGFPAGPPRAPKVRACVTDLTSPRPEPEESRRRMREKVINSARDSRAPRGRAAARAVDGHGRGRRQGGALRPRADREVARLRGGRGPRDLHRLGLASRRHRPPRGGPRRGRGPLGHRRRGARGHRLRQSAACPPSATACRWCSTRRCSSTRASGPPAATVTACSRSHPSELAEPARGPSSRS